MNKHSVINKINEFLSEKDYVKARKLIRNDLKRLGTKDEYYMYLGLASIDAEDRLKNYEKALDANPQNLDAAINLANAYDEVEEFDKAIEFYNKALEIDKNCALIYNNRGYTYYQKKDYEKALKDYDKALLLNPKLQLAIDNRVNLVTELEQLGDYDELVKNSNLQNNDYKYYFNLGMAEARLGKYDEAEAAYKKSIELNPDFAPVYLFFGILEHGRDNFDKAEEYYSKSIEVDKNMVDAYFNRAQLAFASETNNEEHFEKALSDLEIAVKLDEKFVDAYYSMAVIYKKLEQYKKSLDCLNKLLEIAPDSVNARALKKLLENKYIQKS